MSKKQHWIITGTFVLFAILLTFLATTTFWYGKMKTAIEDAHAQSSRESTLYDADKLGRIEQMVDTYFIGETDRDQMTETLADAMIAGLGDEWSYYISAEEYASYLESVANAYVGIGVTISWEDENPKGFTIIDVTPDSPAYAAGLQIGDYMHKVNGEDVTELGMDETKMRVRGEEGTDVTLTILRGDEEFDVVVTRASIKTVNVTWELLDDDVAYIRIRNFEAHCAEDSLAAIKAAMQQGAKGIVFDLRFNPGGLKSELVTLLDALLPAGPLFRSLDYSGRETVDESDARCLELPMAVLVNVDSYSAAEFFAAAMQEYGAATIVGTQTYGKGYFQTTHELPDGSAIHISTGKYFTPNGVSLVGVGITPDRVLELSDEQYADLYYGRLAHEDDLQLQEAVQAVKSAE